METKFIYIMLTVFVALMIVIPLLNTVASQINQVGTTTNCNNTCQGTLTSTGCTNLTVLGQSFCQSNSCTWTSLTYTYDNSNTVYTSNFLFDGRFETVPSYWQVSPTLNYVDGIFGKAYQFHNVSDEIINTTIDTPLQFETGNFSVSVWLYSTNNSMNVLPRIWEKSSMYMAMMGDKTNGKYNKLAIEFQNSTTAGTSEFWSQTNITINTWTHVVLVWDLTHQNATWYFNNVPENSSRINVTGGMQVPQSTAGFPFLIGNRRNYNRAWNGTIDELMVFNKTLNSSEVANLYNPNSITPPSCQGLISSCQVSTYDVCGYLSGCSQLSQCTTTTPNTSDYNFLKTVLNLTIGLFSLCALAIIVYLVFSIYNLVRPNN